MDDWYAALVSPRLVQQTVAAGVVIAFLIRLLFSLFTPNNPRKKFPVWATIELALTILIVGSGASGFPRRLYSAVRRYGGSLFGLTSRHQVLVDLGGVERLFSQPHHIINPEPAQYTIATRVFGGQDSPDLKAKLEATFKDVIAPVERLFVNEAAAAALIECAGIPEAVSSLVTFSSSGANPKKPPQRWERSASIRLIPGEQPAVEANFQSLIRDLGACIAIPLLYGHDLLNRYDSLLDDLWRFDNDLFPLLMIGLPTWAPFRMMREGVAARSRLLTEIEALQRRIDQHESGGIVDFGADMSDVSYAALGRAAAYRTHGWTLPQRAAGELGILWGQNANTQAMLFWLLTYVYSTPGLVDQLREEISPYITITTTELDDRENGSNHSIKENKITAMDHAALARNCPRLKACLFESYRLANEATSIRYVEKDTTVPDAGEHHHLKAGTFISAPHSVIQRDPSVYPDPNRFVPDRFLEEVFDEDGKKKLAAKYGKLKPWGVGTAKCKGRTFAEREILSLAAAVLSLWDVSPAPGSRDKDTNRPPRWELPPMVPGTGVKKPIRDIRVIITGRHSLRSGP
ncbi:putative cytochrome P450 [Rhypophila decipiens]|uniref:Cytochrome P450 n=1 Tax=Rhypophila decipiens TaxID=261697 RepID=A0AAN6Y682_9PEZI|nr:putative cytochrome P450 [Rhypophila decipiens]